MPKCIIGVELLDQSVRSLAYYADQQSIFGRTPASIVSAGATIAEQWPAYDGAYTPYQNATRSVTPAGPNYAGIITGGPALSAFNSGFLLYQRTYNGTTTTPGLYTAASTSTAFSAQNLHAYTVGDAITFKALLYDLPSVAYSALLGIEIPTASTTATPGAYWGEAAWVRMQELPNNMELASFERRNDGPSLQRIKTLDGSIRQYSTGANAWHIRATFRWSDTGTVAAELMAIVAYAIGRAQPIVLYIPQGIYYSGPYLDLVILDSQPVVTMPAPGVYELTIEGACQP